MFDASTGTNPSMKVAITCSTVWHERIIHASSHSAPGCARAREESAHDPANKTPRVLHHVLDEPAVRHTLFAKVKQLGAPQAQVKRTAQEEHVPDGRLECGRQRMSPAKPNRRRYFSKAAPEA